MGEIKSTLDLVLEKTKNLNLSDKEKRDQKDKELVDSIHGWSEYSEERYNSTAAGFIVAAVSLFFCIWAVLPGGW